MQMTSYIDILSRPWNGDSADDLAAKYSVGRPPPPINSSPILAKTRIFGHLFRVCKIRKIKAGKGQCPKTVRTLPETHPNSNHIRRSSFQCFIGDTWRVLRRATALNALITQWSLVQNPRGKWECLKPTKPSCRKLLKRRREDSKNVAP